MTNEVVVFPDTVELVIDYLRTELTTRWPGATVGRTLPKHIPDWFVRIFRTGGTSTLFVVDAAHVTIETYAVRSEDAHDLAQLARGLLHALPGTTLAGVAVYLVVEFSGPQDLPDPVTAKPRYTQTMQISVRGAAV